MSFATIAGPKARAAAFALSMGIVALARDASADPEADRAAAEALFDSALALVNQGDFDQGCPKFEASLKLLPSSSTLIHIALCHEHAGKIATAWADYRQALAVLPETRGADRQKALEAIATKGIAALESRLPKLRVVVKDAPAGLVVKRDGRDLPVDALGEALPADAGPHAIEASAPGYQTKSASVTCEEGKTAELELSLTAMPAPPIAPPQLVAPPPIVPPPAPPPETRGVPVWSFVVGGAGIAMLGVSAGFLADDVAAINTLRSTCSQSGARVTCPPGYDYASDNARKNRSAALFAAFGIAGVATTTFAVVDAAVTRKKPASSGAISFGAWASARGAGASVRGELF